MDIGALRVVMSMVTSDFTGPAQEASETFRSSGSLIEAASSSIKSAVAEALSGTPLSEYIEKWGEVSESVAGSAGQVGRAATQAGTATKDALSGSGGNQLATSMQQASEAAQQFATVMTQALDQIKGELNLGGGAGLDALDTELQTTGADAEAAASQVAAAMQSIESSMAAAATDGTASMSTLNTGLASAGTASETAGASAVAGGAAMAGAFALAPQIALITGLTVASSKVPEAVKSIIDAGKDLDENTKMVQQTMGTSVEQSSLWVDMFQHYGLGVDAATKATDIFSKAVVTSTQGNNEQSKAFADLGVSVTDANGNLKPMDELLQDTMAAFNAMPDGITKNADAMTLLGRGQSQFNDMLNVGNHTQQAWIANFQQQQQQFIANNQVVTGPTMDAYNKLLDAQRNSSDATMALKETLGNDLLPVETDLANATASLATSFDEKVLPALQSAGRYFNQVWSDIGPLRAIMGDLSSFAGGEFSEAFTQLGELLDGPFGGIIKLLAATVIVGFVVALGTVLLPIAAIATALDLTIGTLNEFGDVLTKATQWGKELYDSMKQAGTDFVQGLIDGIDSKTDELMADVKAIPENIISTITSFGQSPWPSMVTSGGDIPGGLIVGMQRGLPDVRAAALALGQAAVTGTNTAVASGAHMVAPMMGSGGSSNQSLQQTITLQLDKNTSQTWVGNTVNGIFRQQSRRQN